jgi:hypothetical protein
MRGARAEKTTSPPPSGGSWRHGQHACSRAGPAARQSRRRAVALVNPSQQRGAKGSERASTLGSCAFTTFPQKARCDVSKGGA